MRQVGDDDDDDDGDQDADQRRHAESLIADATITVLMAGGIGSRAFTKYTMSPTTTPSTTNSSKPIGHRLLGRALIGGGPPGAAPAPPPAGRGSDTPRGWPRGR
jgi:hypothetical protein